MCWSGPEGEPGEPGITPELVRKERKDKIKKINISMKTTVNFCGNCPFSYADYDDCAIGYSTVHVCTLAQFLKLKDYFILVSDGDEALKTPIWCPLKTEEFTFNFKEFSAERKQEIDSISKEIDVLQDYFDKNVDNDDLDESELDKKSNKLQALYTKLGELQKNEEEPYDFKVELNNSIDEIKAQLSTLEDFGTKLQESLGKLGE